MENLNAEQIKKALECCTSESSKCADCPRYSFVPCTKSLLTDALALINSQEQRIGAQDMTISELRKRVEKAEHDADRYAQRIKELSEENERLKKSAAFLADMPDGEIERIKTACLEKIELDVKAIRADTVRKMQERLKEWYHFSYKGKMYVAITDEEIDQIAKEMLEDL